MRTEPEWGDHTGGDGRLALKPVINPVIPKTTMALAMVTLKILDVAGLVNGSGTSSSSPSPAIWVGWATRVVSVVLTYRSVAEEVMAWLSAWRDVSSEDRVASRGRLRGGSE